MNIISNFFPILCQSQSNFKNVNKKNLNNRNQLYTTLSKQKIFYLFKYYYNVTKEIINILTLKFSQ